MSLPETRIHISLPYLISIITMVIGMSVAYGGYKAGYEQLQEKEKQHETQIANLTTQLIELRLSVERLNTRIALLPTVSPISHK